MSNLYIKDTKEKGRGVYAKRPLRRGELVEQAHVIVVPEAQADTAMGTVFSSYLYHDWKGDVKGLALALGFGSLFNHSYDANMIFMHNYKENTIDYYVHKDIKAGEELLINYNGEPDDKTVVWFDVK